MLANIAREGVTLLCLHMGDLTARAPPEIFTTCFELCDAREPTAYELEMKASVRSGEQIREPMMRAVIEGVGRCVFLLSIFFPVSRAEIIIVGSSFLFLNFIFLKCQFKF